MNYRHAFHAGNFADVVKHAVLARVLLHLREKPAAFRVIDTHAGAGLYDLASPEANRSGEWRAGIHRLLTTPTDPSVQGLLAPYLDVVASFNLPGKDVLTHYPGSPAIVRAFLRPQDRLAACELEPKAAEALARTLGRDRRIKTIKIDGWTALNAYVPPPERRGIVLIDPPFEEPDEFERLARGVEAAHRKWASGSYLLWYPVKERSAPDALAGRVKRSGITRVLRAELFVGPTHGANRLAGCGLMLVNPPWTLADELAVLLPVLVRVLGEGHGSHRLDWIAPET